MVGRCSGDDEAFFILDSPLVFGVHLILLVL